MNVLGFSCFEHDSAACLVRDGQVVAAIEEERLSRRKHDHAFPAKAIAGVLAQAGLTGAELDAVVFYEKPLGRLDRQIQSTRQTLAASKAGYPEPVEVFGRTALRLPELLKDACGYENKILFCDHQLSHAAAAYYSSPFDEAAVLVIDGEGDGNTTTLYKAKDTALTPVCAVSHPHSLGLFYAAMTAYLGFEANEGEYKVMGLASYGKPVHIEKLRAILKLKKDGSFALDPSFFTLAGEGKSLYTPKLIELLGPARHAESAVTAYYEDIAASVQKLLEEAILGLARAARERTGFRNLCLGGSVAHNIVANARLRESGFFEKLWIHFASGENGAALGAALYGYYALSGAPKCAEPCSPYLGPSYTEDEIESALQKNGCLYEKLAPDLLVSKVADYLTEGCVVGWHQGRMEFGPRALGARSLLASACASDMKNILNARVKHREEFRPFAPVVLAENAQDYFDLKEDSPFMLYGSQVWADKQALIPSVTHVDGSARPQTIRREDNPLYYAVVKAFAQRTGVPVLVNTSFNIRGEPIVCTPQDAINCFSGTDIDYLAIGPYLVRKK